MKQEFSIQDYLDMIFKRKWLIIISALAVFISTAIYTFTRPPIYESTSTFMLETRNIGFSEEGLAITQQTRPLEYYEGIMKSRIFRNRALGGIQNLMTEENDINFERKDIIESLEKGLSLSSAEYSDFIQLNAKTNDSKLTYFIAKVATEELKNRCQEIDREELQNAVLFISVQKDSAKAQLEKTERALQEFKEQSDVAISDENGGLIKELFQLENQLTSIQTQKQLAMANLEAYKRRIAKIHGPTSEEETPSGIQAPEVRELYQEIQRLENQMTFISEQLGEDHPNVAAINSQIEEKRQEMVSTLIERPKEDEELMRTGDVSFWKSLQERKIDEELNVFALENKERYYQNLIKSFKDRHPQMMSQAIELMRLTRAKSVSENLYNFLVQKGEESKIKAATGTGGIRIIDAPILPTNPVPVNVIKNLLMGLFIGLGLGLGLAYFKEYTDNSLRTQEDITSILSLPVMGIIPNLVTNNSMKPRLSFFGDIKINGKDIDRREDQNNKSNGKALISRMKSKNPVVESYRSLRSNLQFANMDQSIKTMIVSSTNPSEGKTLTTANLGIVFALLGKQVIIVDTDLRKPKQHKLFGVEKTPGLTEALVEDLPIEDVMHSTDVENLKLIPCGKTPPNPAEILASQKMNDVMKKIESKADLILYDSPPLIAVTDPVLLASKLDGILLVVKHGGTSRFVASNMVDLLRKARVNILGVVLNQTITTRGYGYYKYYSKYYK